MGRFRHRHLVPMPQVESMDELNELVAAGDAKDDRRRILGRPLTVGQHFAGERIEVRLGAERVEALDGKAVVARHARAVAKGTEVLVLDHYLEVFRLKPGAFRCATALARARASGSAPPPTTSSGRRHGTSSATAAAPAP